MTAQGQAETAALDHKQSTCFKRECALAFGLPEIGDSSENTPLP